jgi:hypothetical protein
MERPTHFRHQSRGKAPLDQPQDIRLDTGFANPTLRNERSDLIRRFRFTRANCPRATWLGAGSHAALHSSQTGRARTSGLIVGDEFASGTEPQN